MTEELSHPTADRLAAFSAGRVSEAELSFLSDHLSECSECCTRLDTLDTPDALESRLRQASEEPIDQAALESAVRALRGGARQKVGRPEPIMPKQIGEYEVIEEVGRGGMGVVYRAMHRGLRRTTALKMVLAGEFASEAEAIRFRLEAELAARVRHPNIVEVYETGTHEGRPYLAMEWVDGGTLAVRLDGKPWSPAVAASLVETLARAIHAAHLHGVVHRDLKPANILLQSPESPDEKETPKVADFGLAKPLTGVAERLTGTGLLVGTPTYMSAEQVDGSTAAIGPATDVYALGVMLYELLTGRPPFQGGSILEILKAVTSEEPQRPRRVRPSIPRDLEAVCLKCLEKAPSHRYPTALALADDLRRFQDGLTTIARPIGIAVRTARRVRRRPLVAGLAAMLAMSLVGGMIGILVKWIEADEQRRLADAGNHAAQEEKESAVRQAYRARIAAASAALQSHDVIEAARQLEAAPERLRDWEWHHFHSRLDESLAILHTKRDERHSVYSTPIGFRFGTFTPTRIRWDDGAGREISTISLAGSRLLGRGVGRDGAIAVLVEGSAWVVRNERGGEIWRFPGRANKSFVAIGIGREGRRIASSDLREVANVIVHDADRAALVTCRGHTDLVQSIAFSPDGRLVASASEDNTARVWDAETGIPVSVYRGHEFKVLQIAFRPDGRQIATTSADGTVRQWDPLTGKDVVSPYDRHTGEVFAVQYSPDGQWIASGGTDRTIRVRRAGGRQDGIVLHGHTAQIDTLAFGADGKELVSNSRDGTTRRWRIDPAANPSVLRGHASFIYPVAYSPDGRWIASGGWDNVARVWDTSTGECKSILPHPFYVRTLAFAPDGSWLASTCHGEDSLTIWDLPSGTKRQVFRTPGKVTMGLAVHADGTRIAAQQSDGQVVVLDVATGKQEADTRLPAHISLRGEIAYHPNGRHLAVLSREGRAGIVDLETGTLVREFIGHTKPVYGLTFSTDGIRLATAGGDQNIRVWEVATGKCLFELQGHTEEVFSVAFHPRGTRLASGGRDGLVWLWDLESGEAVARLTGHTNYIFSLAFSPDGQTLVTGSGDGTVRRWDTVSVADRAARKK